MGSLAATLIPTIAKADRQRITLGQVLSVEEMRAVQFDSSHIVQYAYKIVSMEAKRQAQELFISVHTPDPELALQNLTKESQVPLSDQGRTQ